MVGPEKTRENGALRRSREVAEPTRTSFLAGEHAYEVLNYNAHHG